MTKLHLTSLFKKATLLFSILALAVSPWAGSSALAQTAPPGGTQTAVTPQTTLVITPNNGPEGQRILVSGYGFTPNESVVIFADNRNRNLPPQTYSTTVTANAAGNFTEVPFFIPTGLRNAPGSTTTPVPVTATGQASNTSATAVFTASQPYHQSYLIPSAYGAHPGETIQVEGGGFAPNENVVIFINDDNYNRPAGANSVNVTTDANGQFGKTNYRLPDSARPGTSLPLTAQGAASGATATQLIYVQPFTGGPPFLSSSQGDVTPNQVVTISGGHFAPNDQVRVSVLVPRYVSGSTDEPQHLVVVDTTSDNAGNFSTQFTIPEHVPAGALTITAAGNFTGTGAQITVNVRPDSVTPPTTPPNGSGSGTAAVDTFVAAFSADHTSFTQTVTTAESDLSLAAGGFSLLGGFADTFTRASGAGFSASVQQAVATLRNELAAGATPAVAKDHFMNSFNAAKDSYFNALNQAKDRLADSLNQAGFAVAKDQFMNTFNNAAGVYGNQLEVLKNHLADQLNHL